jgi:putative Holliday junction resolvase
MTVPRSPPIPPGRVAGVDYGRRRIGIAVCDAGRILASPLCMHETRGDPATDAAFFRRLAATEAIVGFVVGLPVHADGTTSAMSAEVERFGAWLVRITGLPVAYHDERYSSREAAGLLAGVGLSRGRKKERADAVAAQVVLAAWLDAQRHGDAEAAARPLDG